MSAFRLFGSRRLAEALFFTVEREHYLTADGHAVIRDIVRHPGAVVVAPLDGNDLLLIRQFRAAVGDRLLELPAGKLDHPGEDPRQAALRECEEEVGMRPGRLELLHEFYTSPGFTTELAHLFVARDLQPVSISPQGAEEMDATIERVPLQEATRMAEEGAIVDAKTLIGIYALTRSRR